MNWLTPELAVIIIGAVATLATYIGKTFADIKRQNAVADSDIKQKQANIEHLEAQTRSEIAKTEALVRIKEAEADVAQSTSNLTTLNDLRTEVRELKVEIQKMRNSLTTQSDENATLNSNYQVALTKLEERDGSIAELRITVERLDTRIEKLRDKIENYLLERSASAKKPVEVEAAEGKVSDEKLQGALVDDEAIQIKEEPQKTAATNDVSKTESEPK